MFTADRPQTDGQIKRVNSILDVYSAACALIHLGGVELYAPIVEFAMDNAVHALTGYTPFFVNGLIPPRVPLMLPLCSQGLVRER